MSQVHFFNDHGRILRLIPVKVLEIASLEDLLRV